MAKGIFSSIARWLVKRQIRSMVYHLVKENRLIFIDTDKVSYTDRDGDTYSFTFNEMAEHTYGKMPSNTLFIVELSDIKDELIREYQKQKEVKKEVSNEVR